MAASPPDDAGFLSRWSRRKVLAREGVAPPEPAPPPVVASAALAPEEPAAAEATAPAEPLPTLADVAALAPGAEVRRFVAPGVDAAVRNAALKKLFADPHFNLMDGLDTYIDDYGKPDPLPAAMLRLMAQSNFLGLFSDDPPPAPNLPATPALTDENADLRLQPHDAAGPAGAEPGAVGDSGREP